LLTIVFSARLSGMVVDKNNKVDLVIDSCGIIEKKSLLLSW
jgi:hypothetical protein